MKYPILETVTESTEFAHFQYRFCLCFGHLLSYYPKTISVDITVTALKCPE